MRPQRVAHSTGGYGIRPYSLINFIYTVKSRQVRTAV